MAKGDGVHRTNVRNVKIADNAIQNIQAHNEREKEMYSNSDIVLERKWILLLITKMIPRHVKLLKHYND